MYHDTHAAEKSPLDINRTFLSSGEGSPNSTKKFQRDKRRLALLKSDKQTFVALPYHILCAF